MDYTPLQYGLLAALAIGLLVAAVTDMRSRTIANWLNAAIALGAPLFWFASGLAIWPDMAIQLGLGLATFAILAGLFAIGAMGGGDVKLLSALARWVAPLLFLKLLVVMAIIGGVLTLAMGTVHVMRRRKERLAIPYGVAIATAGLWVMGNAYLPFGSSSNGILG